MGNEIARKKIDHARKTGDIEALRAWGAKGAEVANQKKAERREVAAYFDERAAAQEEARRRQANEHIVPIDPEEKDAA